MSSLWVWRYLALLPLVTILGACGVIEQPGLLFGGRGIVEATVAERLNGQRPVAVDLVIVYDAKLQEKLGALSAREWFATRQNYVGVVPEGQMDLWSWEWVPAQQVEPQRFDYRMGALASLVFVSYDSPGDHRAQLQANRSFHLLLEETGFDVKVLY